jgi:hypothetical protein
LEIINSSYLSAPLDKTTKAKKSQCNNAREVNAAGVHSAATKTPQGNKPTSFHLPVQNRDIIKQTSVSKL